jgi:Tfp pilus assembly protein PilN
MRAVNLLPREEAKQDRKRPAAPLITGVAAAVILAAVLVGGFVHESAGVAKKRTELDAARTELSLVPKPAPAENVSSTLVTEEMLRNTALSAALRGRMSWDRLLREISLVLPDDVWLASLSLQAPVATIPADAAAAPAPSTATTTPVPSTFTMNGTTFTHESVARLLSRLALVPDLEDVTLVSSSKTKVGKRAAVAFSVAASIRAPGGSS